jgi:phage-related protein
MDCYAADGVTLDYGKATLDDYPTLAVGANVVSWTGTVTSVTITPRWRDM